MADTFLFSNNAGSTLASGINDTDATLFLNTGDGVKFPSPGAGQRFSLTLTDVSGNVEIVYCSSRTIDTLTVTRAAEDAVRFPARAWNSGDAVELRLTTAILEQVVQGDTVVIVASNADQVDGLDASATAQPNQLLALDGSSILQASVANALLLEGGDSAYHRARGNHTGTQLASTISDLESAGREIFHADGNFTVPPAVTSIYVTGESGWGGGGGGGAFGGTQSGGGGAGGGRATANLYGVAVQIITVTPGEVIALTIGQGGAGGAGGPNRYNSGSVGVDGGDTELVGPVRATTTFVVNKWYRILVVGDTDFTAIGASSNAVGVLFQATGAGGGTTGTANELFLVVGTSTGGVGGNGSRPTPGDKDPDLPHEGGNNGGYSAWGIGGVGGAVVAGNGDGNDGGDANDGFPFLFGGGGGGGGGSGGSSVNDGGNGGAGAEGSITIYW